MKTEVYSWRVSTELKTGLEREARRRKISLAAALDLAAQEWLKNGSADDDAAEQKRLHAAAAKAIGIIRGGDPYRAENAGRTVTEIIRKRHGR